MTRKRLELEIKKLFNCKCDVDLTEMWIMEARFACSYYLYKGSGFDAELIALIPLRHTEPPFLSELKCLRNTDGNKYWIHETNKRYERNSRIF